jgi:hypothetical protein
LASKGIVIDFGVLSSFSVRTILSHKKAVPRNNAEPAILRKLRLLCFLLNIKSCTANLLKMRIKGSGINGSVSHSISVKYKTSLFRGAGSGFHNYLVNTTNFQFLIRIKKVFCKSANLL